MAHRNSRRTRSVQQRGLLPTLGMSGKGGCPEALDRAARRCGGDRRRRQGAEGFL